MSVILTVIGIIIAIYFWKYILTGLVGATVFGFIGSFFGNTGTGLGAIIGFLAGIGSVMEEGKTSKNQENTNTDSPPPSNDPKPDPNPNPSPTAQIVSCPSCLGRIKVQLPLNGKNGVCLKCHSKFELLIDENNNVYTRTIESDIPKVPPSNKLLPPECFKILEIERSATPDEIKKAYKKKISECHPDKTGHLSPTLRRLAEEESKKINIAYDTLKANGFLD